MRHAHSPDMVGIGNEFIADSRPFICELSDQAFNEENKLQNICKAKSWRTSTPSELPFAQSVDDSILHFICMPLEAPH